MQHVIVGCGDIGRRIVQRLYAQGVEANQIVAFVRSESSFKRAQALGLSPRYFDLDMRDIDRGGADAEQAEVMSPPNYHDLSGSYVYYTVAPQKHGPHDLRTRAVIESLIEQSVVPAKLVLISTTGVYGDAQGQWVDESRSPVPSTQRALRRYDAQLQWHAFMQNYHQPLIVLRVPGIYARSRLPEARIKQATPVVCSADIGFTNRIHAEDLAAVCIKSAQVCDTTIVLNATDGQPGTITQYLQAVAEFLGEPPLPEITLEQAQTQLSEGMLSYLSESRKISNARLRETLDYTFLYPDFLEGMKV
jgi:nucleoside-diphosphate-sugar epimerase